MEFIENSGTSHASIITQLIANADEILMAVAFLKQSGLHIILPAIKQAQKNGVPIKVVTGQYFALTEPAALYSLHSILYGKSSLHIAHATAKDAVFHPKLYLFRQGKQGTVICGSANLTHGGIEQNTECSLMVTCSVNDKVWNDSYTFVTNLLKPGQSARADLLTIGKYEQFYESQKSIRKMVKAVPVNSKNHGDFSYDKLRTFFDRYMSSDKFKELEEKHTHYEEAQRVLEEIANSPKLTEALFSEMLDELVSKKGELGWWHSGSLFRHRRSVYKYYKPFQKMVRYIRDNKEGDPGKVYQTARNMVDNIEGAGPNYVTEIMMTYNYRDFANLNSNPITALRVGAGVHMKATPSAYTGDDYRRYCALIKEVSEEIGLRDMLDADAFFNDIYWQIKGDKHQK